MVRRCCHMLGVGLIFKPNDMSFIRSPFLGWGLLTGPQDAIHKHVLVPDAVVGQCLTVASWQLPRPDSHWLADDSLAGHTSEGVGGKHYCSPTESTSPPLAWASLLFRRNNHYQTRRVLEPFGSSHVPRYAFFVISLAAGSGPCRPGQCDRSGTPSYAIQKHLPLLVHFLLDPFDLLFVYMTKSPLDFQVLYNGQSFEAMSEVILFTIFDLI